MPEGKQEIERGFLQSFRDWSRKARVCAACFFKVEHLVADRHADAWVGIGLGAEDAERQVLDRKIRIRIVGGFNKAAARRIMGLVESMRHGASDRAKLCG